MKTKNGFIFPMFLSEYSSFQHPILHVILHILVLEFPCEMWRETFFYEHNARIFQKKVKPLLSV